MNNYFFSTAEPTCVCPGVTVLGISLRPIVPLPPGSKYIEDMAITMVWFCINPYAYHINACIVSKLPLSLLWLCTQQAVQYLSLLQGVVLCAFGIQISSTVRFTVIIALSLTSHHATPISVETPVNTSGWISQEKYTHSYQDAQVYYQCYHC